MVEVRESNLVVTNQVLHLFMCYCTYFCIIIIICFHQERSNTPLHVAANAGQALQVELLIVHGADSTKPDMNGKTPVDYAL